MVSEDQATTPLDTQPKAAPAGSRLRPVRQGQIPPRADEQTGEGGKSEGKASSDSRTIIIGPGHGGELHLATGCHPGSPETGPRRIRIEPKDGLLAVEIYRKDRRGEQQG